MSHEWDEPHDPWASLPEPDRRPLFGDPDIPAHDPITGELPDLVHTVVVEVPQVFEGTVVDVPTTTVLAGAAAEAISDWRGAAIGQRAAELGDALVARLHAQNTMLRALRPGGRVTNQAVQPELVWWAAASDTLGAIGKAFGRAEREARDLAGEVVADVRPDKAAPGAVGAASVKVGAGPDAGGGSVKVTRTQGSEVKVDGPAIVDLLPTWLLARNVPDHAHAYAEGARAAVALLLQVTSPPKFKSTALDQLVEQMTNADQGDLAGRLSAAYGRVPKGEPTTTITHVPDAD